MEKKGESEKVEQVKKQDISKVEKKEPVKKVPTKKKSFVEVPKEKFLVTSSPHIFGKDTVPKIMWTVSACLAPAGLFSIYLFGLRAFLIIALSIIGAVGSEYIWQRATGRKITINDGSAFLTGLLLAYNLPPTVDWWLPLVGSAFAIIVVKQFFGGLGMNIFNPALAARAFLLASWPQEMTTWAKPLLGFSMNLTTGATPLDMVKRSAENPMLMKEFLKEFPNNAVLLKKLLLGIRGGCIGETSAVLLILGGLYLIWKKYIDWQVPLAYIGTTVIFTLIFGRAPFHGNVLTTMIFHAFSGGIILGAFFMATDYVTTPSTVTGRIVFAIGCGLLTGIIRLWGGYPEGVCYSIIIMNAFTPLIDDKIRPVVYGFRKERQAA